MRRTVFLGSTLERTVDIRGPLRRSWPDIDAKFFQYQAGIEQLAGARAIALAYETDWDMVRVYFSGAADDTAELLGPGRVLSTVDDNGAPRVIARIEPVMPAPATRLYDAESLRRGLVKPEASAITGVGGANWQNNDGVIYYGVNPDLSPIVPAPPTFTLYKWNGSAWVFNATIAPGIGTVIPWSEADAGGHGRPVDYSWDRIFTVADYMFAGLAAPMQYVYRSEFPVDAHGNAGVTAQPAPVTQASFLPPNAGGAVRFADLSASFYARLAIDVFDACPPAEYVPKLAPQRFITFPDLVLPGGSAEPTIALLTVPVINARGVEFLYRNDVASAGVVYGLLVSPMATESILDTEGVPNQETDQPFQTVGVGDSGSLVLDQPRHPYIKILLGSDLGATVKGAVLSIKREMDQ